MFPSDRGGPLLPWVVLVVGDDRDALALTALTLEFSGFRVVPIDDAGHAGARARDVRPNAIVVDVAAVVAASQFAHDLESDVATRDIPLLLLSGHADDVPQPLADRCALIVPKPVVPADLVALLRALLTETPLDRRPARPM